MFSFHRKTNFHPKKENTVIENLDISYVILRQDNPGE